MLVAELMSVMFNDDECLQTELSDGIAVLVASNDHIQAVISQMEEICRTTEVRDTHMNNKKGKLHVARDV